MRSIALAICLLLGMAGSAMGQAIATFPMEVSSTF